MVTVDGDARLVGNDADRRLDCVNPGEGREGSLQRGSNLDPPLQTAGGIQKTRVLDRAGAGGGPVQSPSVTVSVTDPIEAARVYQKVMGEDTGV